MPLARAFASRPPPGLVARRFQGSCLPHGIAGGLMPTGDGGRFAERCGCAFSVILMQLRPGEIEPNPRVFRIELGRARERRDRAPPSALATLGNAQLMMQLCGARVLLQSFARKFEGKRRG